MQPAARGDVVQPVIGAAMGTTSMEMVLAVGGITRQAYADIWEVSTRFMPPEYVRLIEASARLGKALFPLQMSVFDRLSSDMAGQQRSTVNILQPSRNTMQEPLPGDNPGPSFSLNPTAPLEQQRRSARERILRPASPYPSTAATIAVVQYADQRVARSSR